MPRKIKVKRVKSKLLRAPRAKDPGSSGKPSVAELVGALGHDLQVLWGNQEGLAVASDNADVQVAVLTRLVFLKFNEIARALSNLCDVLGVADDGLRLRVAEVGREDVAELFTAFHALRARPDFAKVQNLWYTGASLAELPIIEEVPNGPQSLVESAAQQNATDGVPVMQVADGAKDESIDAAAG